MTKSEQIALHDSTLHRYISQKYLQAENDTLITRHRDDKPYLCLFYLTGIRLNEKTEQHSKHKTLSQGWVNVGSPSTTLDQQ